MNYLFLKGVMSRYCSYSCRYMLYSAVQWRLQMSHPHLIHAVILACRFAASYPSSLLQGFGVRFLFTVIGVLLKLYWNRTFQGTRTPGTPPKLLPLTQPQTSPP